MSLSLTPALPNIFLSPEYRLSPQVAAVNLPSHHHHRRRRNKAFFATAFTSTETPKTTTNRPTSLYQVLRVKRNASQSEIKSAYRTLAKLYHPDAVPSAASESDSEPSDGLDFIAIHEAYATLSDPAARAMYDLSLGVFGRTSEYSAALGFYSTRRWETDQCW